MCGIIGIVGKNNENIVEKLLKGLEKLEYRGYDSAGIAVVNDGKINRVRAVGKLSNLKEKLEKNPLCGSVGIGHTRWATHGKPTENNAHPMISKDVAVVHNGIIENYKELKFVLESEGYVFKSETDTEVIAHALQRELNKGLPPADAFRAVLKILEGTYALVAVFSSLPETIFASRQKNSIAVGFGERICIGSDAGALAEICDEVSYLENGDIVELSRNSVTFYDINEKIIIRKRHKISKEDCLAEKGPYSHFMIKEIMDQPNVIRKTLLHNKFNDEILKGVERILIVACGTSYYAGMVAKYWFEQFLKIPTDIEIASEFIYRSPVICPNTLAISISQSGETLDTIAAIEYIRNNSNCKTMAIANVKNSATARASDIVFYTEAGMEMGVASTKAFTAQLTILAEMAFCRNNFILNELNQIPALCEEVLELSEKIKKIAPIIGIHNSAIYLGRGNLYPITLEGALKLKEISYIHAEGFAAGEMKHGPIALIDENVPVIFPCPYNELFEKTASNIQESVARGKNIIVFTDEKGNEILNQQITKILLPKVHSALAPILYAIPMQLLAYHVAVFRNTDVDRPRNLAKSVTVE